MILWKHSFSKIFSGRTAASYLLFVMTTFVIITTIQLPITPHFALIVMGSIAVAILSCILFLCRSPVALIVGAVMLGILYAALNTINEFKISALTYPLTTLDFQLFFSNPRGLLLSLGAPPWGYAVFYILTFLAAAIPLVLLGRWIRNTGLRRIISFIPIFAVRALVGVSALVLVDGAVVRAVEKYRENYENQLGIWEDVGLAAFSRSTGLFPFLLYSRYLEQTDRNYFFGFRSSEPPPSKTEVAQSLAKFLNVENIGKAQDPNIIIVHAESTFDPNDVFELAKPIKNNLFYSAPSGIPSDDVQFHGPLLVNTIGGGSWISEFEVLLGLDSRLFGTAGQYTHASLAPYSKRTFLRLLRSKGYVVNAYTIEDGSFYNGKRAYLDYGFQRYYDSSDLGFTPIDKEIMARALAVSDENRSAPYLKFVLLHENHAPHRCDLNNKSDSFEFKGGATSAQNCALTEYARRAKSTEAAVEMAREYLQAEEHRSGRPYVLAVYGDHQPHTFTSTGGKTYSMGLDVSAFRKDLTMRKTIFKLYSSKDRLVRCCWQKPIPITLIPSLLSAYVARSSDEIYLPENFVQYDQCGSDWVGGLIASSYYHRPKADTKTKFCSRFNSLLAAYKKAEVLGFSDRPSDSSFGLAATASHWFNSVFAKAFSSKTPDLCIGKVVITASGTKFGDPPVFKLYADEHYLGQATIKNALDTSEFSILQNSIYEKATDYEMSFAINQPARAIRIEFVNDNWAGLGRTGDSNLWIKSVQVNKKRYTSTDFTFHTGKVEKVDDWVVLWTNGDVNLNLPRPVSSICR